MPSDDRLALYATRLTVNLRGHKYPTQTKSTGQLEDEASYTSVGGQVPTAVGSRNLSQHSKMDANLALQSNNKDDTIWSHMRSQQDIATIISTGDSVSLDSLFSFSLGTLSIDNITLMQNSTMFETNTIGDPSITVHILQDDDISTLTIANDNYDPPQPGTGGPDTTVAPIYVIVQDTDVLCGRGELVNRHLGHKLFHEEKSLLQAQYKAATTRKEKKAIAQELVHVMQTTYNSRFLAKCEITGQWYIISAERALEKAKQVLREVFTPEKRKEKRERYYRPKKKPRHEQDIAAAA
jgi:hypothetical protein